MKKRVLAVVFAAATMSGIVAPATAAYAADCGPVICIQLFCDPTGENCGECIEHYLLGDEFELC